MRIITCLFGLLLFNLSLFAQDAPFNIVLEPINIDGLGGLQSYAVGQHEGKWLIVGGRLDGLHRRQPFAAFDEAGHNAQLIVVDPLSLEKWDAPLSTLPTNIQEQLRSTNMQFHQEGDYLYCVGGYGYSATAGDHTTFPFLTAIEVPNVIDAIISNADFTTYFRQISDPAFQVTGGNLKKINDTYYLLGGQKFIGRYNPMGPNQGPGFIQEYTDAIRPFKIIDTNGSLSVTHLPSYIDSDNLHRRDYNAESQILPNGSEGITMFSGVFQPFYDLPYLTAVTVDSSGYAVEDNFQQFYNHYHCAVLPLYSAENNEMHNVFFGGIAQYYDNQGIMVQDNNVPFVKTIARVTRDENGNLAEYKLPQEMPVLLGAGAEFIPNEGIPQYSNDVLKLDQIDSDNTLVGYIYGGISSTEPNIFWINEGDLSTASSQIYKVFLTNNDPVSVHELNEQSNNSLKMQVFPNPSYGDLTINFNLEKIVSTTLSLYTIDGKKIKESVLSNLHVGQNTHQVKIENLDQGGVFILTIKTPEATATQKILINL